MRSAPGTSGIKTIHRAADQSSFNTREDAKLDANQKDPHHKYLLEAAHEVHKARERACSNDFWKQMERFFAPVTAGDLQLLKYKLGPTTKLNQTDSPILTDARVATGVARKTSSVGSTDDDFFKCMGYTELQSGLGLEFQNYFLDSISLDKRVVSSKDAHWRALFPDEKPALHDEELIDTEIRRLQEEQYQHAANVKKFLGKMIAAAQCELQSKKRSLEKSAMDQLVLITYEKLQSESSTLQQFIDAKNFGTKRTVARCRQFEDSGKSCFSEPHLQRILFNSPPVKIVAEPSKGGPVFP